MTTMTTRMSTCVCLSSRRRFLRWNTLLQPPFTEQKGKTYLLMFSTAISSSQRYKGHTRKTRRVSGAIPLSTKWSPVVADSPGIADELTAQIAPGGRGRNSKDRQFANFRGQFFLSASVRYRYLALQSLPYGHNDVNNRLPHIRRSIGKLSPCFF